MNWTEKKFLFEINVQVHEIFKRNFFFGKYARNGLLGGEIIKWENEKNRKFFLLKIYKSTKICKGKIFFCKYARNGLLGGEIIK